MVKIPKRYTVEIRLNILIRERPEVRELPPPP
jgi:hypothetical protein